MAQVAKMAKERHPPRRRYRSSTSTLFQQMFAGITVENLYLKLPQEVWDFFPLVSIQYRRSACFVLATTWAGVSTRTLFERERERVE